MYDAYYDDYMRNVLGYNNLDDYRNIYSIMPQDIYNMNTYMFDEIQSNEEEIGTLYPDIYKIVYPMVKKACLKNNKPINKNIVDNIVDDVYMNLESNEQININVNVGNVSKNNTYSSDKETKGLNMSRSPEVKSEIRDSINDLKNKETRQQNFLLNDLIKILVLRELIDKPNRPGNIRPNQIPPIRPPYPGRPPIRPRYNYNFDYDLGF